MYTYYFFHQYLSNGYVIGEKFADEQIEQRQEQEEEEEEKEEDSINKIIIFKNPELNYIDNE